MLDVKDVSSGYGDIEILHNISISTRQDEITGIIGPNGSGKSTLLKTIGGVLKLKKGQVIFNEENIGGLKPHEIMKKGIAILPQGRRIFPYMTVLENLEMGGYVVKDREVIKDRIEEVYKHFPLLKERRNHLAYSLSGGQQSMLCIGRALVLRPKIILMDEPSLGLSPRLVAEVYDHILSVSKSGTGLVIVEQNVRKCLSVADKVYVLDLGRNKFKGTPDEIQNNRELLGIYLGTRKM
jgi:branched-chain amino acid transport system ATP-binding protein